MTDVTLREFLTDALLHERALREASERAVAAALELQAAETAREIECLRLAMNAISAKLTATLLTLVTAAILLAINLALERLGR